jgi:hypothetical protein
LITIICQNGGVVGVNGGGLFEINKLPCLHEIEIPKCINVYSIFRAKLGVIGFFVLPFLTQNQYKSYLIKKLHALFFLFCFSLLLFKHKKKRVIKLIFCMKLKSKYINYNIRFLKLLLYDLK